MSGITSGLAEFVEICEVGPRDGLQNEKRIVSVDDKVRFIELLVGAGFREIEATSFVSPKWVPQLADAEEVLARVPRSANTVYSALVPNEKGLERALACGVGKISVFTAASEGFARHNINATIADSIVRFKPVVARAHAAGVSVRGYVSCVVACPYDGLIAPEAVRATCAQLADIGVDELDLGDTIGVAHPDDIERMYNRASDWRARVAPSRYSRPRRCLRRPRACTGRAAIRWFDRRNRRMSVCARRVGKHRVGKTCGVVRSARLSRVDRRSGARRGCAIHRGRAGGRVVGWLIRAR